jgi:hypothetical protein
MGEPNPNQPASEAPPPVWQSFKKAGLFLLFGTILIIPRIRRLRRRVWAWTCIRLAMAACGGWLIWRYTHAAKSTPNLLLGLALVLFAAVVRSSPVTKSVDDLARELNALVVLNGGAFSTASGALQIQPTQIFVHPEQLIVVGAREHCLAEIPLSSVRNISVRPVALDSSNSNSPWEVGIDWVADESRTAIFRYTGAFAEHLARVTESTVRSQWKKGLPVIPS